MFCCMENFNFNIIKSLFSFTIFGRGGLEILPYPGIKIFIYIFFWNFKFYFHIQILNTLNAQKKVLIYYDYWINKLVGMLTNFMIFIW